MGFTERRRLASAATSRCSVSRSPSSRPRSVAERFLGSVTLGGVGGSFADVEPADPGAWSGAETSVGFGNAIATTVPHREDRSNFAAPLAPGIPVAEYHAALPPTTPHSAGSSALGLTAAVNTTVASGISDPKPPAVGARRISSVGDTSLLRRQPGERDSSRLWPGCS